MQTNAPAKAGTAGGILLVVLLNISSTEVTKTALLAAIGAVVSFFVSLLLKTAVKRFREKRR